MVGRSQVFVLSAALLSGCSATLIPPSEADESRARVQELERRVAELEGRNAELEAALSAAAHAGAPAPDILANAPFAASIQINRFSGLVDSGGDGRADLVRLYITPRDGLGRPVQVVGTLKAEASFAPAPASTAGGERLASEGPPPRLIGAVELGPTALREAFRSGFMGTHYTVDVPLTPPGLPLREPGTCLVQVVFQDGLTGRTLRAEATFPAGTQLATASPHPS